ncbi:MAG: hypothetical protein ACR2PK_08770 [Acidimicrobiales bacterium]
MNLLVVLFLIAIVAIGYGLTLLLDLELTVEERVLYGVVVGTVVVTLVGFVFGWWAGMSRGTVIATTLFCVGLSGPGWTRSWGRTAAEWRDFRRRLRLPVTHAESPSVLIVILAISAVVSIRILSIAYGTTSDGGVSAGHLSTFGDWSAHLAYAGSFALADNFPPELPTAAGESFAYHWGVDFFSALFVPLGSSLQESLQISSAVLAITFPGLMFVASQRFMHNRLASAIGVFVFLAAGGTAALYRFFFEDLPEEGLSVLFDLPRSYAFDGFARNWLDNPVTGFLYPQRPTIIGFPIVLMGLALLWQARERRDWRTHLFVGLMCGVLPIFHVFSFGVLLVLAVGWTIIERRAVWAWFLTPALAIGLPIVAWQLPENGADGREWHLGWVLGKARDAAGGLIWEQSFLDFVEFWLLNTGFFIPLVVMGMLGHRELMWRFLPIYGLLLIPNVGIWHFWPGNNAKYLVFFLLLGAPFIGSYLAGWIRRSPYLRVGAVLLIASLTVSGGLDIWRAFEGTSGVWPAAYMTGDDVLVGEWVRDQLDERAVFASANNNVHPVRAIAGRSVVSGSAGRLNDLGVDWVERDQDLRVIYAVGEGFDAVIRKYGIDYVVLGPEERRAFRPADAPSDWDPAQFWDAAAPVVYDIGNYKIYDVAAFKNQ